jgi:hypothetical protein
MDELNNKKTGFSLDIKMQEGWSTKIVQALKQLKQFAFDN